MKSNKTSITVSIDLNDEHEKKLFDYVMSKGSRKKSGYIKRLIYADMERINPIHPFVPRVDPEDEDDNIEGKFDDFI